MRRQQDNEGMIVSSLLAGAAIYFGLSKKGKQIEDLARIAVNRVIDDQVKHMSEILDEPPKIQQGRRRRNKQRFKK
jgi:hypothetical protein